MAKILVVDDDQLLCNLFAKRLNNAQHCVTQAFDGGEAIQRFNELQPDLVLLDMNMPGINGLDVLSHIRTQTNRYVPVIMLSGSALTEHYPEAFDAADLVLIKPLSTRDLIAFADRFIKA